jgi:twinkle protein
MGRNISFGRTPGKFKYHTSCKMCGSKDNLAVYEDQETKLLNGTCMGCKHYYNSEELEDTSMAEEAEQPSVTRKPLEIIDMLPSPGIPERRITAETCKKYGVKLDSLENKRYYPRVKDKKVVGYKCRKLPKSFKPSEGATPVGELKTTTFFGQHLFPKGRILIITCGEEDALAAYDMTKTQTKNKTGYAAVSTQNGHKSIVQTVSDNLQWINNFERVVFCVDQEEEDLFQAEEACKILSPGKGFIAKFDENDASDMCAKCKAYEFYKAVWDAEGYKPEGIIAGADTWELYKNRKYTASGVPLPPLFGLDHCYLGMAKGNLDVIGSFEKAGKSTMIREIVINTLNTTDEKLGLFMLEEFVEETVTDLMAMTLNKRIDIKPELCEEEDKKEAWSNLFQENRVVLSDAHSFSDLECFLSKIRFMHHSFGISMFFIDNLTKMARLLVHEKDNEHFLMGQIMTKLESLCKDLGIYIALVSHVRKEDSKGGKSFTEGKLMRVHDLYGSGDVSKSAYNVIAITRDNSDPTEPNLTKYHLIATRRGKLGSGNALGYNFNTGRLVLHEEAPVVIQEDKEELGGSL